MTRGSNDRRLPEGRLIAIRLNNEKSPVWKAM